MTYRAAVVGCGRIGSEFDGDPKRKTVSTHAGAYSAIDEVELAALSDVDQEKLERSGRRWGITSLYRDYEEMLRKEKLDILSVCTWNSTHLEIVKTAVESGVRAIFCEKPIADSLKNADEIIRLCDERGVILQIDHQRRFDGFHQGVRNFLQVGNLGGIQQVTFYYTAGIANTGSHMFDLLRFFFGDVEWVWAVHSKNGSPHPNDPNIDGVLKFANGLLCAIQACDVRDFLLFEMDCIGTKGRLNLIHSGLGVEFYEVRESQSFSGYREMYRSPSPFHEDTSVCRNFLVNAVEHLIECMETEGKPICSGEDGRAALELICAFHESARAGGRKISLPLAKSEVEIMSR
jgi:predicted dehydrogenase